MRHEWDSPSVADPDQESPDSEQCVPDRSLMEGIRDGSRSSLRILMQRYWGPLVSYASSVLESRDDAEDVVQETFVQIWRRRAAWAGSGAVRAYLYRIMLNIAFNVRRNQKARRGREERGGSELLAAGSKRSPEKDFEAGSLRDEVQAAIAALPRRRREVFVLSRFHGLTHQEIAEALGISLQTVANHMSVALADLRKALPQLQQT